MHGNRDQDQAKPQANTLGSAIVSKIRAFATKCITAGDHKCRSMACNQWESNRK